MKRGLFIDWSSAGAQFANADSSEQIAFFKTMLTEMRAWGTRHEQQMQLASINQGLTPEERRDIGMLGYEKEGA